MAAIGENGIVVVEGELPHARNRRDGPGWWMDTDGQWRPPTEWPEDYPPIMGWNRLADGSWAAPEQVSERPEIRKVSTVLVEEGRSREAVVGRDITPRDAGATKKRRSRQAESDRNAMLLIMGVLAMAALLLVGALILIAQAGAADSEGSTTTTPEVIYAAETDQDRFVIQVAAAAVAPDLAASQLSELHVRPNDSTVDTAGFIDAEWEPAIAGCLDLAEMVLLERSTTQVGWADNLKCVPDGGQWADRYLGRAMAHAHEADVVSHVPASIAYVSGGVKWDSATRQAFVSDQTHPASLQIITAHAGHNPRDQDPSVWRPANPETWCGYAVDWIAVKHRWSLDVSASEQESLAEMLASCTSPTSLGADPHTVLVTPLLKPVIGLATLDE